jgi:voltage-gated potassium channel
MHTPAPDARDPLSAFQFLLALLLLFVFAALIIDALVPLPREVSKIVQGLDLAACALFFVDFCVRFTKAPNKAAFMKWGWIDLIASIPNIDFLRAGRLVGLLRIIRLLRGIRVGQRLWTVFLQNKPRSAFGAVVISTLLLITFSSMAILVAETEEKSNIKTAEDAIWWSVTTVTTVGYGDKVPATSAGRVIAMVLMIFGIILFGTLSGIVASFLLERERSSEWSEVTSRLQALETKVGRAPPQFSQSKPSSGTNEGPSSPALD